METEELGAAPHDAELHGDDVADRAFDELRIGTLRRPGTIDRLGQVGGIGRAVVVGDLDACGTGPAPCEDDRSNQDDGVEPLAHGKNRPTVRTILWAGWLRNG